MLAVTTPAKTLELALFEKVRDRLCVTDPAKYDDVRGMIAVATADVEDHTNRVFAKQVYTETVRGFGDFEMMMSRMPIRAVASIAYKGEAITDYVVEDPNAGLLYRENGWHWTAQVQRTLTRMPMPASESADFTVVYTAGWSLPGDDYLSNTIGFSTVNSWLTDTAGAFPVLAIGDKLTITGSPQGSGVYTVTSWSPSQIRVAEVPPDEAPGANVLMTVRDLPANVEEAAILACVENYKARTSPDGSGSVVSKTVGDLEIQFAPGDTSAESKSILSPLPMRAQQKLQRYVNIL